MSGSDSRFAIIEGEKKSNPIKLHQFKEKRGGRVVYEGFQPDFILFVGSSDLSGTLGFFSGLVNVG